MQRVPLLDSFQEIVISQLVPGAVLLVDAVALLIVLHEKNKAPAKPAFLENDVIVAVLAFLGAVLLGNALDSVRHLTLSRCGSALACPAKWLYGGNKPDPACQDAGQRGSVSERFDTYRWIRGAQYHLGEMVANVGIALIFTSAIAPFYLKGPAWSVPVSISLGLGVSFPLISLGLAYIDAYNDNVRLLYAGVSKQG